MANHEYRNKLRTTLLSYSGELNMVLPQRQAQPKGMQVNLNTLWNRRTQTMGRWSRDTRTTCKLLHNKQIDLGVDTSHAGHQDCNIDRPQLHADIGFKHFANTLAGCNWRNSKVHEN